MINNANFRLNNNDLVNLTNLSRFPDLPGLTGLLNTGNTCYLNSTIQCLSNTTELHEYLFEKKFKNELIKNIKNCLSQKQRKINNLKENDTIEISILDTHNMYENTITYNLYKLLNDMWKSNKIIAPILLKNKIGENNLIFNEGMQHDSQEVLNTIFENIHNELNCKIEIEFGNITKKLQNYINMLKNYLNILNDDDISNNLKKNIFNELVQLNNDNKEEDLLYKYYLFYEKNICNSYSIISELFMSIFCSIIKCNECNNLSTTFESFTIFTLPLTENESTIEECFKLFSHNEYLIDNNKYKCDLCKTYTNAVKNMYIWEPGNIIIIQLKRFYMNNNNIKKNKVFIKYPLKKLMLNECYSDLHKRNTSYDLYAQIIHTGSCNNGHYIAQCKNKTDNNWYEFDDNVINKIKNEEDVISNNAYILFYKKNKI
jgi:ubiquitin carboxyl-terminal hydrolase 2/21